MSAATQRLWASHDVPMGETRRWRIGPMSLWISRLRGEWQLTRTTSEDWQDESVVIAEAVDSADIDGAKAHRYAVAGEDTSIRLIPCTADRAVVTRPAEQFTVPSRERATVYVSSPLWVRVEAGPESKFLADLPTLRPSDTWFGPSPREGEVCYAVRASFRVSRERVQPRPHRVLTALHVENRTHKPLELERIRVPVPLLPVYVDTAGALWTSDVSVVNEDEKELVQMRVAAKPPDAAAGAEPLSAPRQRNGGNMLTRAFSSLFAKAASGL